MLGIESSVLYPARPTAGAAPVSGVDAVSSELPADIPEPDPVTNENALSAIATPMPIMAAGTASPPARPRARDGDAFSAMG
jgi:hypothetical protein